MDRSFHNCFPYGIFKLARSATLLFHRIQKKRTNGGNDVKSLHLLIVLVLAFGVMGCNLGPTQTSADKDSGSKSVRIEPTNIYKCQDGTSYKSCSVNKPYYCLDGELVPNCNSCGCQALSRCVSGGSCIPNNWTTAFYYCELNTAEPCKTFYKMYADKINPKDLQVRKVASEAIQKHPGSYSQDQLLDIYDWVKENIMYQNVPLNMKAEPYPPSETIYTKSGDCKNQAVLIASMIGSIGGNSRVLLIPECGHAYAEVDVGNEDAANQFGNVIATHYKKAVEIRWHKDGNRAWFIFDPAGGVIPGQTLDACLNSTVTYVIS